MAYTSDDHVAAVRLRGQLPPVSADGKLSDADILTLTDEAMRDELLPLTRTLRGEYGVVDSDTPIVAGQPDYVIPSRAQGGSLRALYLMRADRTQGELLDEVSIEVVERYRLSGGIGWTGKPVFAIEGDRVVVLPTPTTSTGYLRFRYYLRPGRLVPVASCAVVSSATSSAITTSATPPVTTGEPFDVVQAKPHFAALAIEASGTVLVNTISGLTLERVPVAGDYVCDTDTTCVLQLPVELHPVLLQTTLVRVFETLGWLQEMAAAQMVLERKIAAARASLTQRQEGAPKRVIRHGSRLRQNRRWL